MESELKSDKAYSLFIEVEKKSNKELTNLSNDEVEKILNDKWNKLNHEEKQKYESADIQLKGNRSDKIRDRSRSPHCRDDNSERDQNQVEEEMEEEEEEDVLTEDEDIETENNLEDKEQAEEIIEIEEKNDKVKPPKRPLSNYMLFSSEMRIKLKDTMPSASIGQVQKEISRKWKELNEEEKQIYNKKAEEAKEQYEKELKEYKDKYGEISNNNNTLINDTTNGSSNGTIIQLARLKRLIMIDNDIKRISKDGLKTIAFSIEEFVKCLTDSAQKQAHIHGRKTVAISDVFESIKVNDRYEFLEKDMKLLMSKCNENKNKNSSSSVKEKNTTENRENRNSITNFFK